MNHNRFIRIKNFRDGHLRPSQYRYEFKVELARLVARINCAYDAGDDLVHCRFV